MMSNRIKNIYRVNISHERLSSLALLNIETEILKSVDFNETVTKLATKNND